MPIYEFRCEACGADFEALVSAGQALEECVECGAARPRRVYSPQAAPHRLAKAPGEARAQERRNAKLREGAKARFSAARSRARSRTSGRADGDR